MVIYSWLSDPRNWGGIDISKQLHQGKLKDVLKRLSPTWTSLGYGIETNANTNSLPKVYQTVLQEELILSGQPLHPKAKPKSIGNKEPKKDPN